MGKKEESMPRISPVVSIYQNPDHIAGLMQQIYGAPLVTGETRDTDQRNEQNTAVAGGGNGGLSAEVKLPALGSIKAEAGGTGSVDTASAVSTTSRTSQSFVYSQAYYLNVVRSALRQQGVVRELRQEQDIATLQPGDFVEYTADFAPSTIPALMDVLTPGLVSAIVEWRTRKEGRDAIDFTNFEKLKADALELDMKANANAALAESVTAAVQSDFRQEKTREYFGTVAGVPNVTIVTICDAQHFTVEDEDRILDGTFTVLGKVTSAPVEGLPVFERNKVLRNLAPDAVDQIIKTALDSIKAKNGVKIGETKVDELIDLNLNSRVPGKALRVIPVAVFL